MTIKKVGMNDVIPQSLPGRDMYTLGSEETMGAKNLRMGVIVVPPHAEVRPCHAHLRQEEIIYVISGRGEAWVDGEVVVMEAGEAVYFPIGAKHMIRNVADGEMRVCFIFSPPTRPEDYAIFEGPEYNY